MAPGRHGADSLPCGVPAQASTTTAPTGADPTDPELTVTRRWDFQHDTVGAAVVSIAVVGLLGLSVLIGPRPPEAPPAADPAPAAPLELPAPRSEEPEAPEAPSEPPAPLTLRIASIAVEAPVVSVGLDGTEMEIPDDVNEVGWYDPDGLGVRPGTSGTAVFASHVDSRSQGRGVLFELRRIQAGDTLEIDLEDGTTQVWRVTEVVQYPKVAMPMHDIFVWSGPSRIAVITCGGEFDRARRSYTDNVVVYAELTGAAQSTDLSATA